MPSGNGNKKQKGYHATFFDIDTKEVLAEDDFDSINSIFEKFWELVLKGNKAIRVIVAGLILSGLALLIFK